jgi:hypothetical protein
MTTVLTAPIESAPSSNTELDAAARMRAIGRQRPGGENRHYLCHPCELHWQGPRVHCWNCGASATAESDDAANPLELLGSLTRPTISE